MNKAAYLDLPILDLSRTVMYNFCFVYVNPKYGENAKVCYMDKGSFIFPVKTEDIGQDITEDVQTRFDTSNVELNRPLPKGRIQKK